MRHLHTYIPFFLVALLFSCVSANTGPAAGTGSKGEGWKQLKEQLKPLGSEMGKTWTLCTALLKNESARIDQCASEQIEKGWRVLREGTPKVMRGTKRRIGKMGDAIKAFASNGPNHPTSLLLHQIKGVNNSLAQIENAVSSLQDEVQQLKRTHLLAVAIRNAEYISFPYYDVELDGDSERYNSVTVQKDSADLVRRILLAFQQGRSSVILRLGSCNKVRSATWDEAKDHFIEFHGRVVDQIHKLTGIEPRVEWMEAGRCKITFDLAHG